MFKSNRDITDLKDPVLRNLANEEKERLNAEFLENKKWLDPLQDIHFELNSNRSKRQKGTCGWIFDQEEYQQWYNSTQSSLLWVYGNAGSGKSVLMSAIVDGILEDIDKRTPDLARLVAITSYIVVDALDECDDREKTNLISLLQQIAESSPRIKVIATSRQEPDIVTLLSHGPKISFEEQKNIKDVKVYVKKELKKATILKEKERTDAHKAIVKRAAGMFRYAALAIQSLQQPWARPLSKHLKNLPDQMAEFYQRSLDQMESQQKEDFSNVFLDAVEEEKDKLLISEIEDEEDSADDDDGNSDENKGEDGDEDSDEEGDGDKPGLVGWEYKNHSRSNLNLYTEKHFK
ncbi:uncharacterized protein DFL_002908 [Arthrobotrys flagrans]|uniref:Nephrocystin 3-like N-terminal domain-containing protein n=1 Tax=Arthrobotrys flagrans TaxID=97331 RepID=A0A437ABU2_ARTFL|nr:hypothetical protein DFL_002908 [Arthrobotrys flagrans]